MLKIIIYGAGKRTIEQINYWMGIFDVLYIVDRDEEKWGLSIEGKEIKSDTTIFNNYYDYILIAPDGIYENQIKDHLLLDMGIARDKIINSMDALNLAMKLMQGKRNNRINIKPKVYDCFMFFNELELLDVRLETLEPYVDYFVIVEINKNFKGKDKPLYFRENKERYEKYKEKIIYVSPLNVPDISIEKDVVDWTIETFQREAIAQGLKKCNANDLIIISDLDEIPNPQKIIDSFNARNDIYKRLENSAIVMEQKLYYYYFDNLCTRKWRGSIFCRYKNLISIQWLRDNRTRLNHEEGGGWHFSYLGGLEKIKQKNAAISDGTIFSDEVIKRVLKTGEMMNPDWGGESTFVPIVEHDYPNIGRYIKKMPEFFMQQ